MYQGVIYSDTMSNYRASFYSNMVRVLRDPRFESRLSHISFTIITEPDWAVTIIQLYKRIIRKKNKQKDEDYNTACMF